jgi:hypothetical protein
MILGILLGRLISLAQRILINFLTAALYSHVSHYSYPHFSFASHCILYFSALTQPICQLHNALLVLTSSCMLHFISI